MVIKKLQASFGCLENEILELNDGLNVVELPNESGKSTWCAFILAMLYGVDSSQKDRADRLSDKNRYRPWGDARMSGSMDVELGGRRVHIERGGSGDAMRGFKAVWADTWDPVEDAASENIGVMLTGATRRLYENSAFIRQDGAAISRESELERRLQSLVSTHDDTAAYADARKKLGEWSRALSYNKKGEISRLEGKMDVLTAELDSSIRAGKRLMEARERLTRCELRFREAEKEVENHRLAEKYERDRAMAEARRELQKAGAELKRSGGLAVDWNSICALRDGAAEVRTLDRASSELRAEMNELASASREPEPQAPASLEGLGADEAEKKAAKDAKRVRDLERKAGSAGRTGAVCAALAAVFVLALAALGIFTGAGVSAFAGAAICAAAGIIIWFRSKALKERSEREIKELQRLYGTSDFQLVAGQYADSLRARENSRAETAVARTRYADAVRRAEDARMLLLRRAGEILGGSGTLEELEQALDRAEGAARESMALQSRYDSARAKVELLEKAGADPSGRYELGRPPAVKGSPESARRELTDAAEAREDALRACARLEGELSSGEDSDVLRSRLDRIEEDLSQAGKERDAIDLALRCLEKADSELRERFSPMLNELAGRYFSALTGGKYDGLHIDSAFSPSVLQTGESVSRDKRSLSAGASEQMYLAMRLAVCSMLFPGEDAPPMVLDDALCAFDDNRMGLALEVLRQEARHRQVILFTCHSREREYLSSHGGENADE